MTKKIIFCTFKYMFKFVSTAFNIKTEFLPRFLIRHKAKNFVIVQNGKTCLTCKILRKKIKGLNFLVFLTTLSLNSTNKLQKNSLKLFNNCVGIF